MSATYVYICSAAHAGSTILDLLLDRHPQIAAVGELSQLPKNLAMDSGCSCGKTVRSCPFWSVLVRKVGEQLGKDLRVEPYALDLGPILAGRIRDLSHQNMQYRFRVKVERILWLISRAWASVPAAGWQRFKTMARSSMLICDLVAEMRDVRVIADSSKDLVRAPELYARYPERVRIVHLMRDGRGVMHSHLKRGVSRHRSLRAFHIYYQRSLRLLGRFCSREHVHALRLEDLIASPEQELSRLCAFLGLDYAPAMLESINTEHHAACGNLDTMTSKSAVLRPVDNWKNELTDADLAYFEAHSGKLNRCLGYF